MLWYIGMSGMCPLSNVGTGNGRLRVKFGTMLLGLHVFSLHDMCRIIWTETQNLLVDETWIGTVFAISPNQNKKKKLQMYDKCRKRKEILL